MSTNIAMKVAAVLWLVWGIVHLFAGIMIIGSDATAGFQAIADAVDPTLLAREYPVAVAAVLNQHGWNLGWIGLTTIICVVPIWRGQLLAGALAALVGGLADVGYFVFIDLGGFARFTPGTVMTIVSATAILLTAWSYLSGRRGSRKLILEAE